MHFDTPVPAADADVAQAVVVRELAAAIADEVLRIELLDVHVQAVRHRLLQASHAIGRSVGHAELASSEGTCEGYGVVSVPIIVDHFLEFLVCHPLSTVQGSPAASSRGYFSPGSCSSCHGSLWTRLRYHVAVNGEGDDLKGICIR